MRVVVLGIGNLLLSDEGVGVRAVERLRADYALPPEVEAIDGGTSAMELLDDLAHADRLIVVDAVLAGREPGAVVKLTGDAVPVFFRQRLSPHQVGLAEVLATLELTGEAPGATVVIGIEPQTLATAMQLSAAVSASLPRVLSDVLAELRALGLAVEPRAATVH
jgi:hydrogenase maturation protease